MSTDTVKTDLLPNAADLRALQLDLFDRGSTLRAHAYSLTGSLAVDAVMTASALLQASYALSHALSVARTYGESPAAAAALNSETLPD